MTVSGFRVGSCDFVDRVVRSGVGLGGEFTASDKLGLPLNEEKMPAQSHDFDNCVGRDAAAVSRASTPEFAMN